MLDLTTFGRQLFKTADLDPVYVALDRKVQGHIYLWLLAYWCFYNAGFACWASQRETPKAFWKAMRSAAENTTPTPAGGRWPRGSERRHFRGASAIRAVAELEKRYGNNPEGFFDHVLSGPMDVVSVMGRVQDHYLFGSWISFKVVDMLDAVLREPIEQTDVEVFLYDTPRKSIVENLAEGVVKIKRTGDDAKDFPAAMVWLQRELSDCRIPHKPKKAPDFFSLETVWCKHHSHRTGHYPIGKDIREIRHGMADWVKHSTEAAAFLKAMPAEPVTFSPGGGTFW